MTNVNIVLYDGFDPIDALGIGRLFELLPEDYQIFYLSERSGYIESTGKVGVWTEYLIPIEVEGILLIPGGTGARRLLRTEPEACSTLKEAAENADYCMLIGNASSLLAQTGLLYHRNVADYPGEDNWKNMFTAGLTRVQGVSWIADGKYYSCTDSMTGFSMACHIIAETAGLEAAEFAARKIGLEWDPTGGHA